MSTVKTSGSQLPSVPTPDQYARFIGQIDLLDVWLIEASVENHHGPRAPQQAGIAISSDDPSYENGVDGFSVRFPFEVRFTEGITVQARFTVVFGLQFSARQPMTDGIFSIFKDVNLPVNVWPFLREFVSTTLGRMGWQPFTLPALKQGVPEDEADEVQPAESKRRRRPSTRRRSAGGA